MKTTFKILAAIAILPWLAIKAAWKFIKFASTTNVIPSVPAGVTAKYAKQDDWRDSEFWRDHDDSLTNSRNLSSPHFHDHDDESIA